MALAQELDSILSQLRSEIPDIRGALVASTDGMSVAHQVSSGDPNRFAAMGATALGLGKRMNETTGGGALQEISVFGADSHVLVFAAGEKALLAVNVKSGGNIGLINLESRSAAQKIAALL